jgi:protein-L-isoaspartate(D-aspartate) O-methyltransferase
MDEDLQPSHVDRLAIAKQRMIRYDLQGRDIRDPMVLKAMARVPRELFVPAEYYACAYDDRPLPIGLDQTISQPYLVALMTQVLQVDSNCTVLEIGTGSGYQTAILACLAQEVFTIERLEALAKRARSSLGQLDLDNIRLIVADGSLGWPGPIQFDRIMVTAGVQQIPGPLLEQLRTDGLLVAPVGTSSLQTLTLVRKRPYGITSQAICPVRFVKLIGRHGFQD